MWSSPHLSVVGVENDGAIPPNPHIFMA
jgi:hypothetical protein